MLLYFFIIFSLYYLLVGFFILGWQRITAIPLENNGKHHDFISVVAPVRNEEKNIAGLLQGMERQSLSKDQFELIIVDDHSEDRTVEIINEFIRSSSIGVRLQHHEFYASQNTSPKKSAITQGIAEARGEIIAMTDGDCRVGPNWLESILHAFDREEVKFVSGAVVLEGPDALFSDMQAIEFASLIGAGAAMINFNYPLMCNGANLAFKKSAFNHVNGYHGNTETSTGDDVFLMQKIHKSFPNSVIFLKDRRALVYTDAKESLPSLLSQRKRWASKWNRHLLPFSWLLPVFLFIHYFSFLVGMAGLLFFPSMVWQLTVLIVIKFAIDFIFLKKVLNFCKLQPNIFTYLLCELLYPFYAILFGVIVHFGKFTWKGRTFKK